MDKLGLIKAILDSKLTCTEDIVIIGGAAMILHYNAARATNDVDILLLRGGKNELQKAMKLISEEHGLPENWINDAAKGFADILLPDFYHRLVSLDYGLKNIRLYVLGISEQVAMKIVALREQDLEDLDILLPRMDESDKKILVKIMNHLNTIRSDWALKIRYFLEERGWVTS